MVANGGSCKVKASNYEKCPRCDRVMVSCGNLSGYVMTSNPCQWDETFACLSCRVKLVKRMTDPEPFDYSFLKEYKDITKEVNG